jgi:hypothetical protein
MKQFLLITGVVALMGCLGVSKPDKQTMGSLAKQSLAMKKFIKGKRITFNFEGEKLWTQFHADGTTDAWNHKSNGKYKVTGLAVKRIDKKGKIENILTFPSVSPQSGDQVILREGGETFELSFINVGSTKDRSAQSHYANPLPANIRGAFVSPEIQNRLAVFRKVGHPVTMQELDKWYPSVPAEQNAATILWPLLSAHYYDPENDKLVLGDAELEFLNELDKRSDSSSGYAYQPIPESVLKQAEMLVQKHKENLGQIRQALSRKKCRYPIDLSKGFATRLPHLARMKLCCRLLHARSLVECERGNIDQALTDILSILQLAHTLDREPYIISSLVQFAMHKIAIGPTMHLLNRQSLTEQQLLTLSGGFRDAYNPEGVGRAFVLELCTSMDVFKMRPRSLLWLFQPLVGSEDADGLGDMKRCVQIFSRPTSEITNEMKFMLEAYGGALQVANMPFPKQFQFSKTHWRTVSQSLDEKRSEGFYPLAAMLLPGFEKFFEHCAGAKAGLDCLYTVLAIERYRLGNKGSLPANLQALSPHYLPSVTIDPFDGKRLRYWKISDAKCMVYSIGKNQKDDKGQPGSRSGKGDIVLIINRPASRISP